MSESEWMRRFAKRVADIFPVNAGEDQRSYLERFAANVERGSAQYLLVLNHGVQLDREMAREYQAEKDAWIARARTSFVPSSRSECVVCGKFASVAQAHHVVPLASQYDRGFARPDHEHVWICPTHHAILHLLLPPDTERSDLAALGRRAAGPIGDLSTEEIETMLDLIRRSARGLE